MAIIGSIGPIIFEVSERRTNTFSELAEKAIGRWENHEPINEPVISEFLGAGQDEIKLSITFSSRLGVSPAENYQLLRHIARTGRHYPIIIGGVPLSNAEWYIESVEATSRVFYPRSGSTAWCECLITVKEYN